MKRLEQKNPFFNSWKWLMFNRYAEGMKQRMPEKIFSIHYEEMVQRPNELFNSLCGFLNIPYNDSMLEHSFAERMKQYEGQVFYQKLKNVHVNLLNPINTSNIGKWKTEMKAQDIAIVERITAKYASEKYGYNIQMSEQAMKVSSFRLFLSKLTYHAWFSYTRGRYNNYSYNKKYKAKHPFI